MNRKTYLVNLFHWAWYFLLPRFMIKLPLTVGERVLNPWYGHADIVASFWLHLPTCTQALKQFLQNWLSLKQKHMQRQGGVILNVKIWFNNISNVKHKVVRFPRIFDSPVPIFIFICLCNTAASWWTGIAAF